MCHLLSDAEYTNENYNTKFNTESNITCEMSLSLISHSFPIAPENMSITIHFMLLCIVCYDEVFSCTSSFNPSKTFKVYGLKMQISLKFCELYSR